MNRGVARFEVTYSSMHNIILSGVSKRSIRPMIPGCFTRNKMSTSLVSISGLFLTRDLSMILTAHLSWVSLLIPSLTVEKLPLQSQKRKAKAGKHPEKGAKTRTVVCQCMRLPALAVVQRPPFSVLNSVKYDSISCEEGFGQERVAFGCE